MSAHAEAIRVTRVVIGRARRHNQGIVHVAQKAEDTKARQP
jgi:hypothetical protein